MAQGTNQATRLKRSGRAGIVAVVVLLLLVAGLAAAGFFLVQQGNQQANQGVQGSGADRPSQQFEAVVEGDVSEEERQAALAEAQAREAQRQAENAPEPLSDDERASEFSLDPSRTDWNFEPNGRKVVYLTFDDGPSDKTQQVLDILDKYNCKATFFVTNAQPEYAYMIAEAYSRGHTIGMHTSSHDYAYIYSSPEAYYADLAEIASTVEGQIGYVPCFIRFPGGSSNAVSANYTEGIMTYLTDDVVARGYQYYDWNASCGDGEPRTEEEVIENATSFDQYDNIVLLMHDSTTKQATIDGLPEVIEYYQDKGYTFEPITRDSIVVHHGVSN